MSERLPQNHEANQETLGESPEAKKNLERLQEKAEQSEVDPIQKHVESLRQSVEQQAVSRKELGKSPVETSPEASLQSFGTSKGLKNDAYNKTLERTRQHLSTPDRALSKVIHQPKVEASSEFLAKTIARPSIFFFGSMGALVGSGLLLYLAKHNGYTYNFTVFLLLLVAGFITGALLELLYRLIFRRK